MKTAKSVVFCFVFLIGSSAFAETFRFGFPLSPKSHIFKAFDEIYTRAFSAMGVDYESVTCVPSECALWVKQGKINGEGSRHDGYEKLYPDMLKVGFSIIDIYAVTITYPGHASATSLAALVSEGNLIGYQTGYRGYENALLARVPKERLLPVSSWREALGLLSTKRIDYYLGVEQVVVPEMTDDEKRRVEMSLLDELVIEIYPFLDSRYQSLQEPLTQALEHLAAKGELRKIYGKHQVPYRQ